MDVFWNADDEVDEDDCRGWNSGKFSVEMIEFEMIEFGMIELVMIELEMIESEVEETPAKPNWDINSWKT